MNGVEEENEMGDEGGTAERRRMGRPKVSPDEDRRGVALEVAEQMFLETGFQASTMSDVARRTGMSKKTIYRLFSSKEALLGAVLERRFLPLTVALEENDPRPLADTLAELLLRAVTFILNPSEIGLMRLIVSDPAQSKCFMRALDQIGIFRHRTTLSTWMSKQAAEGRVMIGDPGVTAEMLIGLVLGDLHPRMLLGEDLRPSAADLEGRVAYAVRLFLHGALPSSEAVARNAG